MKIDNWRKERKWKLCGDDTMLKMQIKKRIRNGRSANIENGMVKQKKKQKKKSIPDFSENKIEKKVTNVE